MLALTVANLKMMARNRQTTFWALVFPLILVAVFGLFDFTADATSEGAIVDLANNDVSRTVVSALGEVPVIDLTAQTAGEAAGRQAVARGDLDFLVVVPEGFGTVVTTRGLNFTLSPVTLVLGSAGEERNLLLTNLVQGATDAALLGQPQADAPDTLATERAGPRTPPYFDLVLMGLVAIGIMTHSIISIAVRISNYRNLSILKRMLVTPLAIWKFFAAEVLAQLVLAVIQAAVIVAVGVFVFQAQLVGGVLHMLPVIILGSLVFLNIGFILSAWANSPAAASGMGNVVSLPMMFFAGTFFSTSALPWVLPYFADALPLAPMIAALREIGLHGATVWEVWPQLAWLTGWTAVTGLVAVRVFRFS